MPALLARAAETTNSSGVLTLARYTLEVPEFGGVEECFEDGGDIAAAGEIGFGHAVDESLRRIVTDKADGELARDELGCGGMSGEHVQQVAAFLFAILLELFAEYDFLGAGLVTVGLKRNAPPRCGRSTVQPVRMRATCVTSACV